MRLDLSRVQALVDDLMTDTIKVTRDSELTTDDSWNETTGTYTPPADDAGTIYDGPAMVWPESARITDMEKGGEYLNEQRFFAGLPVSANVVVLPRDLVTVTASENSGLVDKTYRVLGMMEGTYEAMRRIIMYEDTVRPQ